MRKQVSPVQIRQVKTHFYRILVSLFCVFSSHEAHTFCAANKTKEHFQLKGVFDMLLMLVMTVAAVLCCSHHAAVDEIYV